RLGEHRDGRGGRRVLGDDAAAQRRRRLRHPRDAHRAARPMTLTRYRYADLSEAEVERLCARPAALDGAVLAAVEVIEAEVRAGGDEALRALNARFDTDVDDLRVPVARLGAAWEAADPAFRQAIETAAANLRAFHAPQRPAAYAVEPMPGVR